MTAVVLPFPKPKQDPKPPDTKDPKKKGQLLTLPASFDHMMTAYLQGGSRAVARAMALAKGNAQPTK